MNTCNLNIIYVHLTYVHLSIFFPQIFDGGNAASKLLGTYCSSSRSALIQSSTNQMYIKFRSSGLSRGRGFSLKYTTGLYKPVNNYVRFLFNLYFENYSVRL